LRIVSGERLQVWNKTLLKEFFSVVVFGCFFRWLNYFNLALLSYSLKVLFFIFLTMLKFVIFSDVIDMFQFINFIFYVHNTIFLCVKSTYNNVIANVDTLPICFTVYVRNGGRFCFPMKLFINGLAGYTVKIMAFHNDFHCGLTHIYLCQKILYTSKGNMSKEGV
jgi:hypothetical protein